jgi:hypothetical protein
MAVRANKLNKRQALDSDAHAWLRGEPCGFFKFQNDDALEAVWNEYGDDDSMFWRISLEKLEAFEDAWLESGEDDEYGFNSFFVYKYYSDDEKRKLWTDRGNKSLYRWSLGMRKPEPLTDSERQNEC